jgi:hypothetical protein
LGDVAQDRPVQGRADGSERRPVSSVKPQDGLVAGWPQGQVRVENREQVPGGAAGFPAQRQDRRVAVRDQAAHPDLDQPGQTAGWADRQ